MPLVFDDEQSPASAPASGSGRLVFDDEAPKAVSKSRSAADIARDVGVTALKGAVALPESIVGLADIPTGGRVGKALEGAGVKFKETQDILSGQYSEQQQAANKKVQEADGFVNTAAAALQNPSTIATAIGESIPQMIGGAGIARMGIRGAEKIGKTVAPWIAGAVGEGTMAAGSAAEGMRQESADGLLSGKQTVAALGSGAGTAILGAAGGKIAQKFGFGDMDTILAQGGADAVAAGAAKKGFLRQMAEGGISEGVFEEMPQSIQETMWQNWANDKPLMEGTGNAAAMGMLAGMGMGIGGGGYNAAMSRVAAQDQPPLPVAETGITEAMPGVENGATDQGGQVSQVVAQGTQGAGADLPASGVDSQLGASGERVGTSGGAGISGTADGSAVSAGSAGVPGVTAAAAADTTAADALITPKAITALDRVTELDTEATRLQAREAELSADNGYGEMFNAERQEVAARRAELAKERESITASWPKAITGQPTSFSTEAGVRLEAQYALMDAGELTTSHDENLRPTPTYPPELQPRQRDRAASEMQIAGIVQRLDPARLGESADAANGAPIVGADGLVESGNARTIALKRIYQAKGQRADEYKQFLKDNAQRFGLAPEQIDGMAAPVLVRVRTTPVNRAEFARQANAATVAQMSPSEQAKSDAARIDSLEGLNPDDNGDFMTGTSRDFVRGFMARIPGTEQSGMIDAAGNLSQTGYTRLRNAVLAKAYGDSPVLLRMVESLDDNTRNLSKALIQAAPTVAKARQSIQEGLLFDADITPDLMSAVEELSRLKDDGKSVHDALAQAGMFGEQYSPETRELLQFLADNIRRPRKIAEFIQTYFDGLNAAGNPNQGSLLGDAAAPAKGDLMNAARRNQDGTEGIPQDSQTGQQGGEQRKASPGNQTGTEGNQEKPGLTGKQSVLIDGRPYKYRTDNDHGDNFNPGGVEDYIAADVIERADEYVRKYYSKKADPFISEEDRARASALLNPLIKRAEAVKADYDQKVIDIAKRSGAIGQMLAPVKGLKRAIPKLVKEEKFDIDGMKDMLRSTIVVSNYEDAQRVIDEVEKEFDLLRAPKNRTGETQLRSRGKDLAPEDRRIYGGYADVLMNVVLPGGVIAEIQINIPSMLSAKEAQGHKLYEAFRDAPEGSQLKRDINDAMQEFYTAVFEARRSAASFQTAADLRNAPSSDGKSDSGRGKPLGTNSPASDIPNTSPFGNSTLSSPPNESKNLVPGGNFSGTFMASPSVDTIAGNEAEPYTGSAQGGQDDNGKSSSRNTQGNGAGPASATDGERGTGGVRRGTGASDQGSDRGNDPASTRGGEVGQPGRDGMRGQDEDGQRNQPGNRSRGNADLPAGKLTPDEKIDQGLAEFGAFLRQTFAKTGGVRMLNEEERAQLMPALVKILEGLIEKGVTTAKAMIAQAQAQMKRHSDEYVRKHWNKIERKDYSDAAEQAIENVEKQNTQGDLFSAPAPASNKQADLFAAPNKPKVEAVKPPAKPPVEKPNKPIPPKVEKPAPAGRDIPQKTGRNYAFGDDDLTYEGGWLKKATQNVDAVELLKSLQAEGRQASREEQSRLAKFVGWGSSEVANSLFGDKLDKYLEQAKEFNTAKEYMDRAGKGYLNQREAGFYNAFMAIHGRESGVSYYGVDRITAEQLDRAKPDTTMGKWSELRDRLKAALTDQEWSEASRSTQYAHYTSKPIVKAMWQAMDHFGFKGGAVLEPGAGIGVFPGLMSPASALNSVYTGIEFDSVTGGILKQLFPDERVLVESFIDSKLPENFYDVAAGNPPFGDIPILSDPKYKKHAFLLHDYFFAKTLDSVKPGGVVAFISSNGTMDKQGDKARAFMAERADMVGAIRLPNTAFKQNAGTEVVTDIIFLRKKVPGEKFEQGQAWAKSVPINVEGKQFSINEYFVAHPEMVMGNHSAKGSMYGKDSYTVMPTAGGELAAKVSEAIQTLPKDIITVARGSSAEAAKVREIDFNPKAQKEGNYYVTDAGVLMQREGGFGVRAEIKNAKDEAVIKDFTVLRDAVKQAHYDQLNDGDWEKSLAGLQKAYKTFVKTNGQVNQNTKYMQKVKVDELDDNGDPTGNKVWDEEQRYRFPLLSKIQDDPDYTLVAALESFNEETGEIKESNFLNSRVLNKPKTASIKTPHDALLSVLNDTGKVDIGLIAERMAMTEREVIDLLGTAVYQDPVSGWVMADEYLSGNVKKKLKEATEAASSDKRFERNVDALREAQPRARNAADITAQIGMAWIPEDIYEQFLQEKTGVKAKVIRNDRTGQWTVSATSGHKTGQAVVDWGTPQRSADEILQHALTGTPIRITKTVGSGSDKKTVFDEDATEAAIQKLAQMRKAFAEWLWQDSGRINKLVPIYNDKFNSFVARKFDGRHLTMPGATSTISVFDHVKRGAWRIVQQGNTYLAHAVGSGKAQPLDAKVLTPEGWRQMGDIWPGDMVISVDGSPTMVEAVFPQGDKEIFRVEFSDGSATECCEEHLWMTQNYRERSASQRGARIGKDWPSGRGKARSLRDIANTLVAPHLGAKNHSIPMVAAVQFSAKPLPLDPYVVGVLLGDGCTMGNSVMLSSADQQIIDQVAARLPDGCEVVYRSGYDYAISWRGEVKYAVGGGMVASNPVINSMRSLGLMGVRSYEKLIPDCYLFNTTEARIALLQGLLDTDGTVEGGGTSVRFSTTSPKLADGVKQLVQSLGGIVRAREKMPSYTYDGVRKVGRKAFDLCLSLPAWIVPFRLVRKAAQVVPKSKYAPCRYITEVVPVGRKPAQCIRVAHESHLYVTDDFIVTHNTFQMVISAMEQKRLGLINKPMMVVPNHMLQQFAREWMELYPAARLMVADEKGFHTDNRRRWVSRVAMSDLDGVIITHAAFKKLDLDPVFKQKMIEEQIDYLRAALEEAKANSDTGKMDFKVKQIEKRIERLEQRLKAEMSGEGKDKNVRFDETGVDMLYVDEAHEFRKLDFVTTRSVKGIDPTGSLQASDLWMKTRWLAQKNPNRYLVMASGTPVTNTMAELYTVQRFMANDTLEEAGIERFDDWSAMYGQETSSLEPNAVGGYETQTRFNKFVNVGELTSAFREFADVLTGDHLAAMLGDHRPKLKDGVRKMVLVPKPAVYSSFLQQELGRRLEASKNWKRRPPDQMSNPDPVMAINNDGSLSAIDLRFFEPSLPSDPDSKLNRMIDEVIRIYKETSDWEYFTSKDKTVKEPVNGAAQMVFSEVGFGAGVTKNRGFNARAWMEKRLRDAGVPLNQVAFMSDYKKSQAKLKLFRDVNAGRVRILVGTSKNMGTGVNAQQRLIALHHLDAPWYPADLEQREGRIIRQGNKHAWDKKPVEVYAYAMKGTYDEQRWGTLARKQVFIDQALSGDADVRDIEDLSESSEFDKAAAMIAEDPRLMQAAGLRAEIEKLERLFRSHEDTRARANESYRFAGASIEYNEKLLPEAEKNAAKVQDLSGDKFIAKVGGESFDVRKDWGEALLAKFKALADATDEKTQQIGEISGFKVVYYGERRDLTDFRAEIGLKLPDGTVVLASDMTADPVGIAMRSTNAMVSLTRKPEEMRRIIAESKDRRAALETRLNAPFQFAQTLADRNTELAALEQDIEKNAAEKKLWRLTNTDTGEELGVNAKTELEAKLQAIPWRRYSMAELAKWKAEQVVDTTTMLSRASAASTGRMPVEKLQAVADRITKSMKNMPKVNVFESPDSAGVPGKLRAFIIKQGALQDVEGALHDGEIYLFASGLADEARAEQVLAEHEVTHYGLRGILGDDLKGTLQYIWANNNTVRKAATELAKKNGISTIEATEEVLADMPAKDLVGVKGWRRLVLKVRDWLGAHGFKALSDRLTEFLNGTMDAQAQADLIVADLVRRAREFVRNGPPMSGGMMGDAMLSRSAMESLSANMDRGLRAMQKAISEKATVSRAMYRDGLGWVDFVWGDEGKVKPSGKTKGGLGISHILEARMRKDGLTREQAESLAFEMVRVIAAGIETKRDTVGSVVRIGYEHDGKIVWLTGRSGGNAFAVTGYEIEPDAQPAGRATALPTQTAASRTRDGMGAGPVASGATVPSLDQATRRDTQISSGSPAGAESDSSITKLSRQGGKISGMTEDRGPGADLTNQPTKPGSEVTLGQSSGRTMLSRASQSPLPGVQQTPPIQPPSQQSANLQGGVAGNQSVFNTPEPSKIDDIIFKLQDKHIDLKRAIQGITDAGRQIADKWNTYMQEELFHGRSAKRVKDFADRELTPMLREMALRKVSIADLDKYLWARHAKEANALIEQRDPGVMVDDVTGQPKGSGMTDQEADDYFAGLSQDQRNQLDAIAKKVDDILTKTREMYVSYGLEDRDTVQGWADMFQHYVPLMREDKDGGMGIGQGFSIKGRETKNRTGSTRAVADVLANIATQRERAIVRGEKNRVAVSLAGLVKLNPAPDFWTLDKIPQERVFNEKTGQVETREVPNYRTRDNVIIAKIKDSNGNVKERAIVLNENDERAVRLAKSMKNIDIPMLEGWLGAAAVVTRYFSAINTQYNPVFGVINLIRDVGAGALNLSSTALKGKEAIVTNPKRIASAVAGIYSDARKERKGQVGTSSWAQLWEDFSEQGGQTGYRDMFKTSNDRADAMQMVMDPTSWTEGKWGQFFTAKGTLKVPLVTVQKAATPLFNWLSDYNLAMENAVRLSAYKEALDSGMSKPQAASLAKNLTVNFNRKGAYGAQAGALYAFFNAATQGTARIGETLTRRDHVTGKYSVSGIGKKIIGGGVMLGVMQAVALAMAGFDDDEPPEFIRERNIVIPLMNGKYVSIPMPLGFHVIPNIGRIATETLMGRRGSVVDGVIDLMGITFEAFNPIGSAGWSMQTVAPTILDPMAAIIENKDWTGKPIAKEKFSNTDPTPGFDMAKDNASTIATGIAYAINLATGGSEFTSGKISPTPDQLDYLWGQVTGGVGRETNKIYQSVESVFTGEELPPHKIPLAGRLYGDTQAKSSINSKFYQNLIDMKRHKAEYLGRKGKGDAEGAAEYLSDNPEAKLFRAVGAYESKVQQLRSAKRKAVEQGISPERVKMIEQRTTELMTRFNEQVKSAQ